MKKQSYLYVILTLGFITIISCEKDKVEPISKQLNQMVYKTYINNDSSLQRVYMETVTTYPNEEELIRLPGEKRSDVFLSDKLNPTDSIIVSPFLKVYPGCTRYAKISLFFDTLQSDISEKHIEIGPDTIQNPEDTLMVFNWP